jgi:hypothetical protein
MPALAGTLQAGSQNASAALCASGKPQTAEQQDRVLRFADAIRQTLQAGDESVALIARSGLDLSRFGLRHSHSGVLLRAEADASGVGTSDEARVPWSVRQLYYDCDAARPRLFDQGLAGFLMSAEAPDLAFVSIVFLPSDKAAELRDAALDQPRVARLLAADYSANAYPFSTRYQNCNQWVAELLATAWAPQAELPDGPLLRERAQDWLHRTGYAPEPVQLDSHLTKLVASLMPLIHLDDHPRDAQLGMAFQVSLPDAIEAYARVQAPQARRLAFCHDTEHIVVREGWQPLDACVPQAGDRVIRF